MIPKASAAARRRRGRGRTSAAMSPATRATFQPSMAITWFSPAAVKSALTSRGDEVAQAEQEARGEPGLGLGQGGRQPARHHTAHRSSAAAGPPVRRQQIDLCGRRRARRADAGEVAGEARIVRWRRRGGARKRIRSPGTTSG